MALLKIEDSEYFSRRCCRHKAEILKILYYCSQPLKKRINMLDVFRGAEGYVCIFEIEKKEYMEKWMFDARFCDEKYDFIIRVPWRLNDGKKVRISEDFTVLATRDSDEKDVAACERAVGDIVSAMWIKYSEAVLGGYAFSNEAVGVFLHEKPDESAERFFQNMGNQRIGDGVSQFAQ